ncbi:protein tolB [Actinoplanes sp. SE50]|uniref:hypothetical protein n=1 Tax=unclassified Actinoplanes TaxID=2626549 RepID=UPI00023EC56F|nr:MULTISPECIES: hypothetical protein [unclassified Actinoplanes]AEV81922.1 Protein tolB [Actinoplanes sp. SE50/110]ATO80322.1 protein tolB [Actinoplanes sp. SE50]SLL97727.1 protein tolB [Actinoplanes sp. SE50/110]
MRAIKTGLVATATVAALLISGCTGGGKEGTAGTVAPPVVAPSSTPAAVPSSPPAESTRAATIDGTLLYANLDKVYGVRDGKPSVLHRSPGRMLTLPSVSPDGRHLAYVEDELTVSGVDGKNRRTYKFDIDISDGSTNLGPAWTADSAGLLVRRIDAQTKNRITKVTEGIFRIADGSFQALPKSLQGFENYLMSGDGKRIFFIDKGVICSTAVDGSDLRKVPVIGAESSAQNPSRLQANVLGTVNADGSRITAILFRMTDGNDEAGGTPDRLIDTATGKVVPTVVKDGPGSLLILRDGSVLAGTGDVAGTQTLTLFSAAGRVLTSRSFSMKLDFDARLSGYAE